MIIISKKHLFLMSIITTSFFINAAVLTPDTPSISSGTYDDYNWNVVLTQDEASLGTREKIEFKANKTYGHFSAARPGYPSLRPSIARNDSVFSPSGVSASVSTSISSSTIHADPAPIVVVGGLVYWNPTAITTYNGSKGSVVITSAPIITLP